MSVMTIEQLYEKHIKSMPTVEKLQLMTIINQQLVKELALPETVETPKHSIMERHGLGAEIWQNIDEIPEEQKNSPQAILKLANTLSVEESETILQAAQEYRRIDWEMWKQTE